MELRDLLLIDVESLSAIQAKQVTRDAIEVLTRGVTAEYQGQLKKLLITAQEIATGHKVGDNQDTLREEVLQKIQDAEARGDRRTARYLAESMVKHDLTAAEIAENEAANTAQKFIDDDIAASEARRKEDQQQRIDLRTQELLRVDGSTYSFSLKLAREQATREIMRARYEDDINDTPKKPDPQAILDAHKASP